MPLMQLVLLVLCLLFILVCCCANLLYWYESLNSQDERIPSPRPGLTACTRHFFFTLGSHLLCLALTAGGPFLLRKPACGAKKEGGAFTLPPLILIHGLYNNAGAWLYLAKRLRKEGYWVSSYVYSSFFTASEAIVQGLEEHIGMVERQTGQRPVLIGHSLGGLLARMWLGKDAASGRVQGLITLGTPHGGSKLAALAFGALAKSLKPDGALITALGEAPPIQEVPCTSLVSPEDEAVLPAGSLIPPQGWRMRLTPPLPHFAMLFSPRAAVILLEELRRIGEGDESPRLKPVCR